MTEDIVKKMMEGAPKERPILDENGKIISAFAIAVSENKTTVAANATVFGVACAITSLFESLLPEHKQVVLMKLISIERGIDIPQPKGNA